MALLLQFAESALSGIIVSTLELYQMTLSSEPFPVTPRLNLYHLKKAVVPCCMRNLNAC